MIKNPAVKSLRAKVLFIYPTPYRETGLPVGLGTLSAVLKNAGHDVKIFDTAFYPQAVLAESVTTIRAKRGMTKRVRDEDRYLPDNNSTMEDDIVRLVKDYKPDLIGVSVLEEVYNISLKLTRIIKKNFKNIPVIVGGVLPTLAAESVISEDSIDIICLGEGESALLELCNKLAKKESFIDINGLWIKTDGKIHKNNQTKLHDLNTLPFPDYTGFDDRLFWKAMQGKMYKMVNIVTARGCPFNCTYCAAPYLKTFFKNNQCDTYYRHMDMEKIFEQIHFQIKIHNPEFMYFSSENFLGMSEKEFNLFIEEYNKIKLPFWIQTRIETIDKNRLSELKKVGLYWLSIGLEHGNEEFRKRVLKRQYSDRVFYEKMGILKELDMGASLHNMIGLPFETRELVFDSINANRALWLKNPKLEMNVFLFTPYRGCELHDICIKEGLLDSDTIVTSHLGDKSVLKFSDEFQQDLEGLIRTFNLYVKLPEKYHAQIKVAEQNNDEGNRMLDKLNSLLIKSN